MLLASYCEDKHKIRKPVLDLNKLVSIIDEHPDSLLLVLVFDAGIKKYSPPPPYNHQLPPYPHTHALHSYKFEFFDHDEKGRFWLLMQRYVKEVHVGGDASTASSGKRGSTGSTGSSGSKGRRRSVVDIVFRRKSSVASRGGRRGSSGSTGSGSSSSGFSAEALARVKEEVSAGVGDFTVTKFTRFGERVRLFVINLADSCLKSIDPSTGNTQKSFEFRHITEVACARPLLACHHPPHLTTSPPPPHSWSALLHTQLACACGSTGPHSVTTWCSFATPTLVNPSVPSCGCRGLPFT